jgi:hypothetical protein
MKIKIKIKIYSISFNIVDVLYVFSFPFWELSILGQWSIFMYDDYMGIVLQLPNYHDNI